MNEDCSVLEEETAREKILFFQQLFLLLAIVIFPFELSPLKINLYLSVIKLKKIIHLSDICILSATVLFIASFPKKWIWVSKQRENQFLAAFFLVAVFALIFSPHPIVSKNIAYLIMLFAKMIFFGMITFFLIEDKTFEKRLFQIIIICAFIQCLMAIGQYFIQRPIQWNSLRIGNDAPCSFLNPYGGRWLLDDLFRSSHSPCYIMRAAGSMGHPNVLGAYLLFSLLISYFRFFEARLRKEYFFYLFFIPLQIFTLMITYSRAAIGLWFLFSMMWFFRKTDSIEMAKRKYTLLTIVLGMSLFSFGLVITQYFPNKTIEKNMITRAKGYDMVRVRTCLEAYDVAKEHFFLGIGPHNYFLQKQKPVEHFQTKMVHNIYLLIFSEEGIFGLLFFLAFVFLVLKRGYRERSCFKTFTIFLIFVALLFHGLTEYYHILWQNGMILFFLTAAMVVAFSRKSKENSKFFAISSRKIQN